MEWVVALTAIGCGTGIIITFIDKAFGGDKHKAKVKSAEQEARLAQERAHQLEVQLVDARRQNEQLQKQVEWHSRLLETQDRMMKQLTGGATGDGAGNGDGSHAVRHTG